MRSELERAKALRELGRSGGKLLLLPLKIHNSWWGTYSAVASDQRGAFAGALKGGSCPYDSEVVDSAMCEQ